MSFREILSVVETLAKIFAVLAGGVWALAAFFRNREGFPKANVSHRFTVLDLDDGQRVLRVDLVVKNIGKKLLHLKSITTRLQQISPLAAMPIGKFQVQDPTSGNPEVPWPTLRDYGTFYFSGEREIEPGEDQTFQFDYVIPIEVKIVQAYSYVTNPAKWRLHLPYNKGPKEIGWNSTDVLFLPEPEKQRLERSRSHVDPL